MPSAQCWAAVNADPLAGPDYLEEDAITLATLPKGAPRIFRSGFSLGEPGTAASFKVVVILTTGNQAGSNAVTVERPS